MKVRRIVANLSVAKPGQCEAFYAGMFGLRKVMDLGFILTFDAGIEGPQQLSVASEGGSGTPVPDLSIEVDDLEEARRRAIALGAPVEYGPVTEPWGVRRFHVRDPAGKLLNVLCHEPGI